MKDQRDPASSARRAPLADGEVDWMLLETAYWPCTPGDQPSTAATLLVSCHAAAPVGALLAPMPDVSRGIRCCRGRGAAATASPWASRLVEFAVVYARATGGLDVLAVDALLARMKVEGVRHVVVVSPDLALRRALRHADSWVVGSAQTDLLTAGVLADVLHNVVMAPAMWNCLDFHDLDPPIGTPDAPGVLAEALHHWGSDTIEFVQAVDEAAFRSAGSVALLPLPGPPGLQQLVRLVRAVRARLSEGTAGFAYGSPRADFHASWQSTRVTLVRFLCAP